MPKPAVNTLLSVGSGVVLKCSINEKDMDEGVFQFNLVSDWASGHRLDCMLWNCGVLKERQFSLRCAESDQGFAVI